MSIAIRKAVLADLERMMQLERATFTSDPWSAELMRAELENPACHYLIAECGDRLAGYAGVLAPRGAAEADVQTIAVAASDRRQGLGRRLMCKLIEVARDRGADQVFLEVRADNEHAQTLYRALGFEQIGTRPRYYQPDGVDAQVMRKRLEGPRDE